MVAASREDKRTTDLSAVIVGFVWLRDFKLDAVRTFSDFLTTKSIGRHLTHTWPVRTNNRSLLYLLKLLSLFNASSPERITHPL